MDGSILACPQRPSNHVPECRARQGWQNDVGIDSEVFLELLLFRPLSFPANHYNDYHCQSVKVTVYIRIECTRSKSNGRKSRLMATNTAPIRFTGDNWGSQLGVNYGQVQYIYQNQKCIRLSVCSCDDRADWVLQRSPITT